MGRGRAKAKQVKVARQLKYNSGGTDFDRLQAELGSSTDQRDKNDVDQQDDEDPDDDWTTGSVNGYHDDEDEGADNSA
jgi:hypothetical protein